MPDQLSNEVNEIKAKAWNECITPRLDAIRAWFKADVWREAVGAYLAYNLKQLQVQLNKGCESQREEDRLRGRILMLSDLLDMPNVIENNIAQADAQKHKAGPGGKAGY